MEAIIRFLPAVLNIDIYCVLVIFTEIIARAGMGQAFYFKKSRGRIKKDNAQRSLIYKIFGLYHISATTHAPHHLKKYTVIRICNLVSLFLTPPAYLLIPYMSKFQIVFNVLVAFHALFLFGTLFADALILSNTKEYGKMLDFDKSRKP